MGLTQKRKSHPTSGPFEYLFARLLSLGCVHLFVCAWQEDNPANANCVCCGDGQIDRGTSFISPIPTANLQLVVDTNNRQLSRIPPRSRTARNGTAGHFFLLSYHPPIPPRQESDVGTETGTGPITPKVKPSQSQAHRVGYHSTRLDATAGQTRQNSLLC